MGLAELAGRYRGMIWFALAVVVGCGFAAVQFDIWWLWILAALAVGDVFALYIGKGFYQLLDSDPDHVSQLRERYKF